MTEKIGIHKLNINGLELESNVLLAPLAGVTDVGFRSVCRDSGAALSFTEMVSVKGLYYKNQNTSRLLLRAENETPCAVQLFGSDEGIFERVIGDGALDGFDLIDINMGCPVQKVVKNGEGCALMNSLPLASRIISACAKAALVPVSVKFRKGFDASCINAVDFAKMCEDSGAAMVTVHGRLRTQYYSGRSDRDIIAAVKRAVKIPVIANGDIFTPQDAREILNDTGADGIMVARGCLGNPGLFSHITGSEPMSMYQAITRHAEVLCRFTDERFTVLNMRKHLLWYLDRIKGGKQLKVEACKISDYRQLMRFCTDIFDSASGLDS